MMAEEVLPAQQHNALGDRTVLIFTGAGRLKPGVSLSLAQADLKTIAAAQEKEYPDANQGQTITAEPLTEAAIASNQRQGLLFGSLLLMAIVGLVLLIACSNVANLLMARAASRSQEIAVRLTLGASRWRLIRQLLTESVMLGLMSGILGFFFGYEGCQALWSLRPAEVAQNFVDPHLNANVFVFVLVIALLTGLIFGIAPALRSSRTPIVETLKEGTPTVGRAGRSITLANALLVGQVAVSLVLLVTAALFLRSVQRQYTIDPGFEVKNLALFMLYPGQQGYDRTKTEQFYKEVRDRLTTVPGVASLSWATDLPLWKRAETGIVIEGSGATKEIGGHLEGCKHDRSRLFPNHGHPHPQGPGIYPRRSRRRRFGCDYQRHVGQPLLAAPGPPQPASPCAWPKRVPPNRWHRQDRQLPNSGRGTTILHLHSSEAKLFRVDDSVCENRT
jgi:predicted permease